MPRVVQPCSPEILEKLRRKEMTGEEAAKRAGCSKSTLYKQIHETGGWAKGSPPADDAPLPTEGVGSPATSGVGEPPSGLLAPAPVAVPPPASLEDAVKRMTGAPGLPTVATQTVQAGLPTVVKPVYDPEDVEAGEELLSAGRETVVESVAEYAYDMDPDDPDLKPVKKPSRFFEIVMGRQKRKTAFVGKLANTTIGFLIAAFIEAMNISRAVRRIAKKRGLEDKSGLGEKKEPGKKPQEPPPAPKVAGPMPAAPVRFSLKSVLRNLPKESNGGEKENA